MEMNEMLVKDSLPRSRFLDDTQRFLGGALRDIKKTAARETSICLQSDRKFYESYWGMQLTGILWIQGPYHEVLLSTD